MFSHKFELSLLVKYFLIELGGGLLYQVMGQSHKQFHCIYHGDVRGYIYIYILLCEQKVINHAKVHIYWLFGRKMWNNTIAKSYFGAYIFKLQSLCYMLFSSSNQFSLWFFRFIVNLVSAVNSLIENAYITNNVHGWHTWSLGGL